MRIGRPSHRTIRLRLLWLAALTLLVVGLPHPVWAQLEQFEPFEPFEPYRIRPAAETVGEDYHIELSASGWLPTSSIVVASEALGIAGDNIDLISDLGVEPRRRFPDLRLVLRPGPKHKFKVQYNPLTYPGSSQLTREFVFNGLRYNIGIPVQSMLQWKMLRVGYEYDFFQRPRGYAGFMLDARVIDASLELTNEAIGSQYAHVQGPIPSIGFAGRGYILSNVSLTGEVSFIPYANALLEQIDTNSRAKFADFDIYATLNLARWAGVQIGYRRFDLEYVIDLDSGDLQIGGLYLGGTLRY